MREGWEASTIGQICDVDWGNTSLTKKAYVDNGQYLAVSAAGCDGRIGHAEHAAFTPVLSAIGAQCGRMFWPEEDFTAIKNTITLTPKPGFCESKFLFHLLDYVDLPKRGAAQPFMSKGDVKAFPVTVPPLPEQRRIVAILDEAFEGIAAAKANTEKNLENAQEVFESYLQKVFLQNTEAKEQVAIDDLGTLLSGGTPSKKCHEFWGGNIPWASGKDMKKTRLSDTVLTITERAVARSSTKVIPAGSLLILIRGMGLAHGVKITEVQRDCAFNQDIKALILDTKRFNPRVTLYAMETTLNSTPGILSSAAHGTLKVDIDRLKQTRLSLPGIDGQVVLGEKIDELNNELHSLKHCACQEGSCLIELKKSLLHQAFNGDL